MHCITRQLSILRNVKRYTHLSVVWCLPGQATHDTCPQWYCSLCHHDQHQSRTGRQLSSHQPENVAELYKIQYQLKIIHTPMTKINIPVPHKLKIRDTSYIICQLLLKGLIVRQLLGLHIHIKFHWPKLHVMIMKWIFEEVLVRLHNLHVYVCFILEYLIVALIRFVLLLLLFNVVMHCIMQPLWLHLK